MGNPQITSDMSMTEAINTITKGVPRAQVVVMQMLDDPRVLLDILLLDALDIRGEKVWYLFSDCCKGNFGKFKRTLMALRDGAYSETKIQGNLELCKAIPFLDDSVQIEGVPSYDQFFGPGDPKWEEYIKANVEVVVPRIKERIRIENGSGLNKKLGE